METHSKTVTSGSKGSHGRVVGSPAEWEGLNSCTSGNLDFCEMHKVNNLCTVLQFGRPLLICTVFATA